MMNHEQQLDLIRQRYPRAVIETDKTGMPILWASPAEVIELLKLLKEQDGLEYRFLADLCGYDDMGSDFEAEGRFVVVYQLYSPQHRLRIRVKCRTNDEVPTAVKLWAAANWAEREVFDLIGVKFKGHPDLRRILMDERWQGHPLQKDYPLRKYQIFTDAEPIPKHLLGN